MTFKPCAPLWVPASRFNSGDEGGRRARDPPNRHPLRSFQFPRLSYRLRTLMRFVCDSCRAQYMISDDKVGARAVKVRCKKCGHVILVRKQELLSEASAQPPPEPMPHAAAKGASPGEAAQNESQSEAAQDEAAHNEAAHDGEAQNEAAQNEQFAREEGQNEQCARANAAARSILEGVADDEIGAVFDHAISSLGGLETDPAAAPPPGPTAEEREAARPVEEPPSNGASDQPGSSFQWFVAI